MNKNYTCTGEVSKGASDNLDQIEKISNAEEEENIFQELTADSKQAQDLGKLFSDIPSNDAQVVISNCIDSLIGIIERTPQYRDPEVNSALYNAERGEPAAEIQQQEEDATLAFVSPTVAACQTSVKTSESIENPADSEKTSNTGGAIKISDPEIVGTYNEEQAHSKTVLTTSEAERAGFEVTLTMPDAKIAKSMMKPPPSSLTPLMRRLKRSGTSRHQEKGAEDPPKKKSKVEPVAVPKKRKRKGSVLSSSVPKKKRNGLLFTESAAPPEKRCSHKNKTSAKKSFRKALLTLLKQKSKVLKR